LGIVIAMRIEACSIVKHVLQFSGTQLTSCIWLKETSISVAYVRIMVMDWPGFVKLVYASGSPVMNCTNIVSMQISEIHLLYSNRSVNFRVFIFFSCCPQKAVLFTSEVIVVFHVCCRHLCSSS